jgi:hypothetical protein
VDIWHNPNLAIFSIFHVTQLPNFPDAKPYIQNNRTLVPVRFVAEHLGATVDWDNANRIVTITSGEDVLRLKIGGKTMTKNGVLQEMDVAPAITNNRTMVPLRFVSENLGVGVEWVQSTLTVVITTNKDPGNIVVLPPSSDDLDKRIQEMAKVNSSVGNLYNADAEDTRDFISNLDNVSANLDNDKVVMAAYVGKEGGRSRIFTNDTHNKHDITIVQTDRTKLSFDATWVMLDYLFDYDDAAKVWYSLGDYIENTKKSIFTPETGSVAGYTYSISSAAPNTLFIHFDKK